MIEILIYSKNRPLQLYSLLESLYEMTDANISSNVSVIHRYDKEYNESIEEIKSSFKNVNFVEQQDFKNDTTKVLESSRNDYCMFLVDDIIFKDRTSLGNIVQILKNNPDIVTYSLRLGLQLNFCYPLNSHQPIPNGNVINGIFVWDWRNSIGDWNYPLSLDGHIFRKSSVASWINRINFNNPNQLEDRLQHLKNEITGYCVCSTFSTIVNLPLNRVQDEYKNRNEEMSSERLLEIWQSNKKINIESLYRINNSSAHFPVELSLVSRK